MLLCIIGNEESNMTKKHFVALAKHIRMILDPHVRLNAAIAVAAACQEANPKFDFDRFYVACGVQA
jgi:hypothetical protein